MRRFRIGTGDFAKRSFRRHFVEEDFAFQHHFGFRRDLDIDGLAFDHAHALAQKRARDLQLVLAVGRSETRPIKDRRMRAVNHGDRHTAALGRVHVIYALGLARDHDEPRFALV